MLSQRQTIILKAIVEEFIQTAEPVGSKSLMNKLDSPYSSATIRNEMAELELLGLLEKTHTSSGRIPSSKGYRYYVDHLMEKKIDEESKYALQQVFDKRNLEIDEVIKQCCEILSQMTNLTSVVLGPDATKQTLQHIKLFPIHEQSAVAVFITNQGHTENKMFQFDERIPLEDMQLCCDILNGQLFGTPIGEVVEKMNEIRPMLAQRVKRSEALFQAFINAFVRFSSDNVYFSGKTNMLYHPEFSDIEKLRRLMQVMENSSVWRQIKSTEGISVQIGTNENVLELDDVSVVSSTFKLRNNEEGQLMVVGPTRMDYDKVISMLEYMTTTIESLFVDDNEEGERRNE